MVVTMMTMILTAIKIMTFIMTMMMMLRMTVKSMQVVAAYSKIASADFNSICSVGPKKPLKPSTRSPRSASPPNSSATNALLVVALVIMYLE